MRPLAAGLLVAALSVAAAVPRYETQLPGLPLAQFQLRGGFGEDRGGHFHAGLDLSTGGVVGARVLAPANGWVERIRSSGSGYGRSLYLRLADGRTVVFGHLDAFVEPLAAYVDSAQRSSGQYEQDLWPALGRFRFTTGQQVAWGGESGAGPPHLHVEIRREDWAIQPLLAGFTPPSPGTPRLERLVLEPIDDSSFVSRCAAPVAVSLATTRDTLVVQGRVRAIVRARDPASGGANTPPWSVAVEWKDEITEARFDSLSWATDMTEVREVIDNGRITGSRGLVLYASPGARPRVLRSARPLREAAGVLSVDPGESAQPLRLMATSPGGATIERRVWVRGPRADERGPDTTRVGGPGATAEPVWRYASLPDRSLRVRVTGTPAGLHGVRLERGGDVHDSRPAVWDGGGWTAVITMSGLPDEGGFWLRGRDASGQPWLTRGQGTAWLAGADLPVRPETGYELVLPIPSVFERGILMTQMERPEDDPASGLRARGPGVHFIPDELSLRPGAKLSIALGAEDSPERVGLYHREARGWSLVRSTYDPASRTFRAELPGLGTFALLADDLPPRITPLRTPPRPAAGPYSRWALTAAVVETGSGLDAGSSYVEVDGRRVPTEWDADARRAALAASRAAARGDATVTCSWRRTARGRAARRAGALC